MLADKQLESIAWREIGQGGRVPRGRKPLPDDALLKKHTVYLTDEEWGFLQGKGNANRFLRNLIRALMQIDARNLPPVEKKEGNPVENTGTV